MNKSEFFHTQPILPQDFDVTNSFAFQTSEQARDYYEQCLVEIEETPTNIENEGADTPLIEIPGYGEFSIRTFRTAELRKPVEGHVSQKVLLASPHCDDEVIATGAFAVAAAARGDDVRALEFTVGSAGRMDHGFDEKKGSVVRLAETLRSAKLVGINSVDILVKPDGTPGMPEWFWDNNEILRPLGVAIGRLYDTDIVAYPFNDPAVDAHIDHNATARVMDFATGWGQDPAFHPNIPFRYEKRGKPLHKLLYSVWSGGKNVEPNFFVPYDVNGPIAQILSKAITLHKTQSVPSVGVAARFGSNYAAAKILRDYQAGLWRDINNPHVMAREMYTAEPPFQLEQAFPVSDEVLARIAARMD
ncbi:PIG-L family deacetylase [Candidatus Roizmanbacteria bacterium]|nr:MAG: PIG-L family deacetylase [Candidatus Roizmanbacteria bacterium]